MKTSKLINFLADEHDLSFFVVQRLPLCDEYRRPVREIATKSRRCAHFVWVVLLNFTHDRMSETSFRESFEYPRFVFTL